MIPMRFKCNPGCRTAILMHVKAAGVLCFHCCDNRSGTRDARLALGKKMGADHVINAARENPVERVKELTGGLGPNMVIVTTGNQYSLQQAIEIAPRGSDIV